MTSPTFEAPPRFNMADYFLDARIREGMGERTAIIADGTPFTYADVQSRSNRIRHALTAQGFDEEDRALFLLPDGIDFAAAWFGVIKAGGVFCMANPASTTDDIDYLLGYTRARAVFAHESILERLEPALAKHPRCKLRVVSGREGPGSFAELMSHAPAHTANADTSRDDVVGWLFTSGTTGKPKGAVHFHHDFPWNTERYAKQVLQLSKDDVFVSVSRLFFGYATGTNLMFPFSVGGTAVLFAEKPSPERLFKEIRDHSVTVLTNVPTMIRQMLDSGACADADLSSVRMCLSAGEALPADLFERWHTRFPNAEILDGIGSAELFHIYITNYPGEARAGTLGRIVPGYEAKVCDDDGKTVDAGELGRLWIRGDSSALCYWGDQERTKETFRGEWVVSADLFRCDVNGYFTYAGRADDMLKVRGAFVSPLEIEAALATHPRVEDVAVIGQPDDHGLMVPVAFVVLRKDKQESVDLETTLKDYAKQTLAKHKYPHRIHFVQDLPRNDRGKVVRKDLRA